MKESGIFSTTLQLGRALKIEECRIMPFRKMENLAAESKIIAELSFCSTAYLGIDKERNDKEVIAECTKFVKAKFSMLGSGEIREAFIMCSAGEFGDFHLRAYFGKFTVSMLGELLQHYKNWRNGEVAKIEKVKEAVKEKERIEIEKMKNEAARAEIIAKFKEASSTKKMFSDWSEIPHFWDKCLNENGLLPLSKEIKLQLWHKAQTTAKQQQRKEYEEARGKNDIMLSKMIFDKILKVEQGDALECNKIENAAKTIFSRLVIWEFLKP